MDYLIVVDMQKDFVSGSLGTPEAKKIVAPVREKILAHQGPVLFTRDTHPEWYLDTQEGKHLPVPHCIYKTENWEIIPELSDLTKDAPIIDKPAFGSMVLAAMLTEKKDEIDSVELIGLCTDICVISNALIIKAALPEVPVRVDSACCAGVTPEKHQAALEVMRSCQIEILE